MFGCQYSQCVVERTHRGRRCNHDALAKSVMDAWNQYLSQDAFKNVYKRLRVVLSCIQEDNGGNNKVEEKRGNLLFRDATIIDLVTDVLGDDLEHPVIIQDVEEDDEISVSSV